METDMLPTSGHDVKIGAWPAAFTVSLANFFEGIVESTVNERPVFGLNHRHMPSRISSIGWQSIERIDGLPGRDIANELGEGDGIAGALDTFLSHWRY